MHRLGFEEEQMDELISILKQNKSVLVKSILSHMATSDDLQHHEFALSQIDLFERLSSQIMAELQIKPIRHILNTSGSAISRKRSMIWCVWESGFTGFRTIRMNSRCLKMWDAQIDHFANPYD
jgi:alanine racemase